MVYWPKAGQRATRRQMINNADLVDDVGSCQQSLFLSLGILFFSERLLEGNCHVFMSKARFLSVCFPGCLKLFTMQGAFSWCVLGRV